MPPNASKQHEHHAQDGDELEPLQETERCERRATTPRMATTRPTFEAPVVNSAVRDTFENESGFGGAGGTMT